MNKIYIYLYSNSVTLLVTFLFICSFQNTQGQIVERSKAPQIDSIALNKQNQSKSKLSTLNKNWQKGGIFDGKTPDKEILNLRTENSKKFNRADGKIDIIICRLFMTKN